MLSKSKNPMQKRVKLFLSLLCLPGLFSCNLDEVFAENPNRMEVMMTPGACMFCEGEESPSTAEDIIYRVEHGENVIFAFTKEDCSSCEEFKKNTQDYCIETQYRFSYINENHRQEANKISEYAVEKGLERTISRPIDGSTPSMYIMSKEKIVELIYGSTRNDKKVLATSLKEYVKESNVYHAGLDVWRYEFIQYHDSIKGPTYVMTEEYKDDFYENVYPIVSKSDKHFNVLELDGSYKEDSDFQTLCGLAGTEDVEGKLIDVYWEDYKHYIDVIDDTEAYLKENYVSSSL